MDSFSDRENIHYSLMTEADVNSSCELARFKSLIAGGRTLTLGNFSSRESADIFERAKRRERIGLYQDGSI
jgi:hypothetical protein